MGQAKARGSREDRIAQAIERRRTVEQDVLAIWRGRAREIAAHWHNGESLLKAYDVVLSFIWEERYEGACHDTSAVMFMLMSELGLSPELCIGEVRSEAGTFDHSWVECGGGIFDAAVCLPREGGTWVGGPIFGSHDLASAAPTTLTFGVASPAGLDENTRAIVELSLAEYAKIQPQPNIWTLLVAFAGRIGLNRTMIDLERRYGTHRRSRRPFYLHA